MPYGDLEAQKVQRFAEIEDLERHHCTIEEMEEHEPHIAAGNVIYAGVDYEAILRTAEERDNPDVILFDGGNNDMPFYRADLKVVVVDPLRAGHEVAYYPGEANLRMADVVVINKMDSASPQQLKVLRDNIRRLAPDAVVVEADSELTLDGDIKGKRVLVIEDGPTLTHGEMQFGAAMVAAKRFGAAEVVDPRPHAVGKIAETYRKYPNIGPGILPAMGYSDQQKRDLQATINAIDADVILSGTPIDLTRIVSVNKPVVRVRYDLKPREGSLGLLEKAIHERLFAWTGNRYYRRRSRYADSHQSHATPTDPGRPDGGGNRADFLDRGGPQAEIREGLAGAVAARPGDGPALREALAADAGELRGGHGPPGRQRVFLGADAGLGRRETIADFARNLGKFADVLVIRTFGHQTAVDLAAHATCPVINGLTDFGHPCQALADLFTLRELTGKLAGQTLAWIGDANNVARSLAIGCGKLGVRMTMATPEGYRFDEPSLGWIRRQSPGLELAVTADPVEAVREAAVVYTDVWASMGQEAAAGGPAARLRRLPGQCRADAARPARGPCSCTACPPTAARKSPTR